MTLIPRRVAGFALVAFCLSPIANGATLLIDQTLNVNDGDDIENGGVLTASGGSHINVFGGAIVTEGLMAVGDTSVITTSGGSVGFMGLVNLMNQSSGSITGGGFVTSGTLNLNDVSQFTIEGGSVALGGQLNANGASALTIHGGFIADPFEDNQGDLNANDLSTIDIFGGSIAHGGSVSAHGNGLITLYGTDFNYDYGPIAAFFGNLTGTLQDGSTVNIDFQRFENGQIVLAGPTDGGGTEVPESGSLTLVLGGLGLMRYRYTRRVG